MFASNVTGVAAKFRKIKIVAFALKGQKRKTDGQKAKA